MEKGKRAVFLDRDGTINVEKGYVHKAEEFELIQGVPEALRLLRENGFILVVITNQSGVARGYYPMEAVHRLHRHMDQELARRGAAVDAYYVCPHHPDGDVREYAKVCECRKPMAGMLMEAARDHSINLASSYMIGDKPSDIEAGLKAGCRSLCVASGHGADGQPAESTGVPCFRNLLEAARAIVSEAEKRGCGEVLKG